MGTQIDEIERILASVEEATVNGMVPAAVIGLTEAVRALNKKIEAIKNDPRKDR